VNAAFKRCGLKVVSDCRGGNRRTHWWMPVVKEAVMLKKEAFRDWLSQGSLGAADRYRAAKRAAALGVWGTGAASTSYPVPV